MHEMLRLETVRDDPNKLRCIILPLCDHTCRNACHNASGCDILRDNCASTDHGRISYTDTFENHSVSSDPDLLTHINLLFKNRIMTKTSILVETMIVIHKTRTCGDHSAIPNRYAFPDIKLTSRANETVVSDKDRRTRSVNTIEVKVNMVFQPTVLA